MYFMLLGMLALFAPFACLPVYLLLRCVGRAQTLICVFSKKEWRLSWGWGSGVICVFHTLLFKILLVG